MAASVKFTKDQIEESRALLRGYLKPGSTVYVAQRHVSRSGMERRLTLHLIKGNRPIDITRHVAAVTGLRYDREDHTVKVGGVGMNMHFHTIYSLSRALWPDGHKCTGDHSCRSNDHSNDYGVAQRDYYEEHPEDREKSYHSGPEGEAAFERMREYVDHRLATDLGYRKDRHHSDGGYALNYETL
jgi:hypothetical protein